MYSQRLQHMMQEIARDYQSKISDAVTRVLAQPRFRNTGEGLDSVQVDIVDGNAEKSPVIVVKAADHIFRLESKGLAWTKLPNMKKMLAWAEGKKSDKKEARNLAWAVAKDKYKNDTWKPKRWRRQSLSAVLKEMNAEMLKEFDKAIEEDMNQALKEG
ncbi:MAG: hypothetical protein O9302_00390 [Cyclobacteriaceae bacterium]|jgi:hypothetical protein|nr:hypothetical protein [Cytophagales bacterium]MCZ8326489.1 hypothetical protein [Cyclobacteriaceae bacterium]